MDRQTLRIVHVVEAAGGGVARHLLDLCAGQRAAGHEVTVIYSSRRADEGFAADLAAVTGVRVHALDMQRSVGPGDIAATWRLGLRIRALGPFDILHGHSSKAGALVRLLPRSIPGARIYTSHALRTMDPDLGRLGALFYGTVERLLTNRRCDALIVGGGQERDAARALGITPNRIRVVANGIAVPSLPTREQVRATLGLPGDVPVVGFVGRFVRQKAPERAIRALAALDDRSALLVMLGAGELESDMRALARDLGVAARVILRAGMNGQHCMPAFDVFALTSRYESMGYVLLEAAAAGVPIVSTPVGIAEDVVGTTARGTLVAQDATAGGWAMALDTWLERNRHAPDRHDRAPALSSYGVQAMVERTVQIYREVSPGHTVAVHDAPAEPTP